MTQLVTFHGGPAPVLRRIITQGAFETRVLLSNGEQLMVSILIPLAAMWGLTYIDFGGSMAEPRINHVAPGVLALAVVASAFTSQAIATGFDRRNGVLRLTATSPLGRSGWLAGKIISVCAVGVIQIIVLGGVAAGLGWRPDLAGLPAAGLALLLGTATFAAFGLWLGGTLRMEAVLALANIIFIALAAVGGVLFSVADLSPGLRQVAGVLPSGLLGEALRESLVQGTTPWLQLVLLLAWAVFFGLLVMKYFKWVSK